jgi:peptide/nickel transport system substrate-binding protein
MVDDRTLEMTLRSDVKFHDGTPLTSDDVVYTLNWQIDPKSKYRFASNMSWLERAEKIDEHRLRVIAKYPNPLMILRLAIGAPILPAKLHASFADSGDFGRKRAVGTGPYKVVSIDSTNGAVLELNRDYKHGSDCKPAGTIGRMHAIPMPDIQTQMAQMMTGGVDLLHIAERDQVDLLQRNPELAVTATQAITFHYLTMDAAGRSQNKALQDVRVRKAIVQALDRELITRTVVPGGSEAKAWDMFCFPIQRGCAGSVKPWPFDLDASRKLLAEAGYANGFDVEISATPGSHDLATAIAGALRKVGVRASVQRLTFGAYRANQLAGKLEMLVGQWTSGGFPDASSTADFYFTGGPRDYWRDPELTKLEKEGLSTVDEAKRKEIYGRLFDKANSLAYVLPLSTKPDVFVHTKNLEIDKGSLNTYGADLWGMRWK